MTARGDNIAVVIGANKLSDEQNPSFTIDKIIKAEYNP